MNKTNLSQLNTLIDNNLIHSLDQEIWQNLDRVIWHNLDQVIHYSLSEAIQHNSSQVIQHDSNKKLTKDCRILLNFRYTSQNLNKDEWKLQISFKGMTNLQNSTKG